MIKQTTVFNLLLFLTMIPSALFGQPKDGLLKKEQANQWLQQTGIRFTENKGQVRDKDGNLLKDVLFTAQAQGQQFYFRSTGISYVFAKRAEIASNDEGPYIKKIKETKPEWKTTSYRTDIEFIGSNSDVEVAGEDAATDVNNYVLADGADGIMGVRNFKKIVYKNIYPSIDLVYYVKEGELEYDFVVHPGADPSLIRMQFKGADAVSLTKDGKLKVTTPLGVAEQDKPYTYVKTENKHEVASSFKLENGELSFKLENYDHHKTLVIDPLVRAWGIYFGGRTDVWGPGETEYFQNLTIDHSGSTVIVGYTDRSTGISTPGAYDESGPGGYVAKFNSSGVLQWATYLESVGHAVAIDACNNVLVASASPVKIMKFNTFSGTLIWRNTYNNGTQLSMAVDPSSNIILAGQTNSTVDVATPGTHQQDIITDRNSFIIKLNPSGVKLWGTYFGGERGSEIGDVAVGSDGSICITGNTESETRIATTGAHKTTHPPDAYGGRDSDVFLAKFNSNGALQWGTYYGADTYATGAPSPMIYIEANDEGLGVAIDDNYGDIVIVGRTTVEAGRDNGIATSGGSQPHSGAGTRIDPEEDMEDGFIAKFHADGSLQWGTYYGGNQRDYINTVKIDDYANIYVGGGTSSDSNIATSGEFKSTHTSADGVDGFIAKFNASGVRQWGSYYGGTGGDVIKKLALTDNMLCINGLTDSNSGIATSGSPSGEEDDFLVKFNIPGLEKTSNIRYISNDFGGGLVIPTVCPSATVSIPYTAGGTFNTGNVFSAQLSNASGSFASPTVIGTLSSRISGTISATIPSGALGNGYKIRIVSSSPAMASCTDNSVYVGIGPNDISGGNGNFCGVAPASTITGTTMAWGGAGSYIYQWQSAPSTTGPWTYITGATAINYSAPASTSNIHYRRRVMTSGGTCPNYSNVISRMVSPAILANYFISTNQYSCGPIDPPLLDANTPTGGTGSFTYQWRFSNDNVSYFPISGVTTEDFNPSIISQTTYFIRIVTSGVCSSVSAPLVIQMDQSITNNSITGIDPATFCTSTDPNILSGSTPTGGTGTYSYEWQKTNPSTSLWSYAGSTSQNFNPPVTSSSIYYRRKVTSGSCAVSYSNTINYTLVLPPTLQSIMGASSSPICVDQTITLGVVQYSGESYQWRDSITIIPGATSAIYTVPASTAGVGFHSYSVVISNSACNVTTDLANIRVDQPVVNNTIQANLVEYGDNCSPGDPSVIDGTPMGIKPRIQWQSSTDGGLTWTDIPLATTEDYNPPYTNITTLFHRIVYSSCGNSTSNNIEYTISNCDLTGNSLLSARTTGDSSPLVLYPNPATKETTLEMLLTESTPVKITITNNMGLTMHSISENKEAGMYHASFDVSTFQAGVYSVKVQIKNKLFYKQLLIK